MVKNDITAAKVALFFEICKYVTLFFANDNGDNLLPLLPSHLTQYSVINYLRSSSKRACNKELALLVEVAAVSPLPKKSRTFRGPQEGNIRYSSLILWNVTVTIKVSNGI